MSKSSSRDVKKRLYEFAKNEFETKSPDYVEVRKAKGAKTFYRGPVPQLILTKFKAILYTVFANYGSIARLYYFNKEGYCIRDSSYSADSISKIIKHLEKTSTRIIRYPKIEPKLKTSDISIELDKEFANIINSLENLSKIKIDSRPLIRINKEADFSNRNIIDYFDFKDGFLEVPPAFVKHNLRKPLLIFEGFRLILSTIISQDYLSKLFALLSTLLYLDENNIRSVLLSESSFTNLNKIDFQKNKENLREVNEILSLFHDIHNFIDFLDIFTNYDNCQLLLDIYCGLIFSKSNSKNRLSNFLYQLGNKLIKSGNEKSLADIFLLSGILDFLSHQERSNELAILNVIKQHKKKNQKIAITGNLLSNLYQLKPKLLLADWRKNYEQFPSKLDDIIDTIIDEVYERSIDVQVEFTTKEFEKPGDIIISLTNNSDTNLGTFLIEPLHWTPREAIEIIGETRRFKQTILKEDETIKFVTPIIPKRIGTINFSNLDIKFNDTTGLKHYLRKSIPSLKIESIS